MAFTSTTTSSTVNTVTIAYNMDNQIDKALVEKSATGFLSDGGMKAKFMGHGMVVLREMSTQGLGDYNRDTGFYNGSITITDKPYQLTQDRGRSFQIDAQDADESGIADLAGQTIGEFTRTRVIPEMDAYALSKMYAAAAAQSHTTDVVGSLTTNTIVATINTAIENVRNASAYDEELVCFVDPAVNAALKNTTELNRRLDVIDFKKGEVFFKVSAIDGVPIIPVPSSRMLTEYVFYDGHTTTGTDQTDGGFVADEDAVNIGFIVLPKKAVNLVKKVEKTRIFSPDKNLDADAWKIDYRVYYDLLIRNTYKDTIYALSYGNEQPDPHTP